MRTSALTTELSRRSNNCTEPSTLTDVSATPDQHDLLRCLNFFCFSIPMLVLSFDGYKKNGLFDVFVHRQGRLFI